MRYAVSVPNFGVGLDAAAVGELAASAETSGWDGFFLWDHLFAFAGGRIDVVDPWIALTVAAVRTSTIRLGTMVTPLPRRRPVVVARQTVAIDRLSSGRLVLGVGTGAFPFEWDYCGEEPDPRVRGDMLDEELGLLAALWTGEPVRHDGPHHRLSGGEDWAAITWPPPLQQPRIPVWVGGTWPGGRPFRRAARWDGVVPMRADGPWTVEDTAGVVAFTTRHRTGDAPFDVVVPGETDSGDPTAAATVTAHERAGATWWAEAIHPWRYGYTVGSAWPTAAIADRIAAGPPLSPGN